ncbi:flavonol synthase/flavanone 3-hydroxylase [Phtheirospermum japonicum]|uniref:Flavonol synthase/flavanone 3-hydroxylase n=1 Tax=Phtheirospermum japonicum TaxID=374723 RepID=A0A830BRR1_9LAMI|nr:flavonol synthase/flavanone 3-hydroxylase [Phtheirospermum japonicum]GFP90525.1 flavonol synthase/flavanone 3-hydroxylase [Phtheirospermum japonicum]
MTLSKSGINCVPKNYILPRPQRPTPDHKLLCPTRALPVIDLSSLGNPSLRPRLVEEVRVACKEVGIFQVINHGIPISITNEALDVAAEFFDLPNETKMSIASSNVLEPIRYGTSLNHVKDKVKYWRDFIKHYAHPISTWINMWPSNPPTYKEKMGNYATAVRLLHEKLMEVILESMGLKPGYLQKGVENGSQVMTINCYPACPEPDLALGLPPHSDFGTITLILQDQQGLEIMDSDEKWQSVPVIKEALIVQLGDQMEVMSNGRYKSVLHRATLNSAMKRLSIASLHSLAMDEKARPAPELVDEQNPLSYKETSFGDFLNFISDKDNGGGRYMDTLKVNAEI